MRYTLVLALVAVISSAISSIAHTQTSDPPPSPKRPGYLAGFDARFSAADTDGDGALSLQEAQSAGLSRIVEHFDRLDTNKDGKITRDEIRALIRNRISS